MFVDLFEDVLLSVWLVGLMVLGLVVDYLSFNLSVVVNCCFLLLEYWFRLVLVCWVVVG